MVLSNRLASIPQELDTEGRRIAGRPHLGRQAGGLRLLQQLDS